MVESLLSMFIFCVMEIIYRLYRQIASNEFDKTAWM